MLTLTLEKIFVMAHCFMHWLAPNIFSQNTRLECHMQQLKTLLFVDSCFLYGVHEDTRACACRWFDTCSCQWCHTISLIYGWQLHTKMCSNAPPKARKKNTCSRTYMCFGEQHCKQNFIYKKTPQEPLINK